MEPPVFIVGTGRCGSSMLTDVVRLHPKILSLSEFFASLSYRSFTSRVLDGGRFWDMLSRPSATVSKLFAKGIRVDRLPYRFSPEARFRPIDVPPLLCGTLPELTNHYLTLYDELKPIILDRGRAPVAEHYLYLFDWLCKRFGRRVAVERSGASLMIVSTLIEMFPTARFVHIYRDGRDTTLSMQKHELFRLAARITRFLRFFGISPYGRPFVYGSSPVYGPLFVVMFGLFPIETWVKREISLEVLARFWSDMVTAGVKYLSELPPEQLLDLRYEAVIDRPREQLERLMHFLGPEFHDEAWLERVSQIPQRLPSPWLNLPPTEREQLTAACHPGLTLLRYL